jgi:uncharacterized protein (DUF1499 family)
MKKAFRNMTLTFAFAIIAALGLLAYIRLAPSDPAVWHVSPVTAAEAGQGSCLDSIITQVNGARAACISTDTPESLLTRLDAIALATPRTTRLAGMPRSGRITWITRTALMGYPDYTTAEATQTQTGTRLDIHARQRFGGADLGVNTARLKEWLKVF